jgi:restriction endonuclease Mrr
MLEILNLSEGSDFFLQKYYSQILPVFFTTSSFTSGAMELAKNFGIILKDGFEMATFTCMIDKFHIIENNKVMDIDIDAFLNWYLN